jgi:hypothetical protein
MLIETRRVGEGACAHARTQRVTHAPCTSPVPCIGTCTRTWRERVEVRGEGGEGGDVGTCIAMSCVQSRGHVYTEVMGTVMSETASCVSPSASASQSPLQLQLDCLQLSKYVHLCAPRIHTLSEIESWLSPGQCSRVSLLLDLPAHGLQIDCAGRARIGCIRFSADQPLG